MPIINVLSKQVSELIAAGEVIERPASVIKELVENSIDAHSASITVEIKNGGVTFMRVSDNGKGIERDDVKNAFLRHATSKISVQDDLDSIATLGFRGEALASICAVSRVELMTKNINETDGTLYKLDGGEETEFMTIGCPQGTTFIVRDLFYNVPARMKFLKKDVAESNTISSLMDRIALSHPEISFTFIRDGKQVLKTSGNGQLDTAIFQVFGKQFHSTLIPVKYEYQGVKISGYISKPVNANRASRSMQIFFVNGRYVRTKTAMAALEQAYKGFIMAGKFPACVIKLEMDCSTLDVNVHPAKLEIRFTNERPIYDCVYHGVKTALSEYDTRNSVSVPEAFVHTDPKVLGPTADKGTQLGFIYSNKTVVPDKDDEPEVSMPSAADFGSGMFNDPAVELRKNFYNSPEVSIREINLSEHLKEKEQLSVLHSENIIPISDDISKAENDIQPEHSDTEIHEMLRQEISEIPETDENDAVVIADSDRREIPKRYIGEAFLSYIIIEYGDDRLMVIDKHAAHERLIYEKLKRQHKDSSAQMLLEPAAITLDREDYQAVLENREMLLEAGFEVDDFGNGTVLLRSVPLLLEELEITEAFYEIARYLRLHKKLIMSEKMEWIFQNTACRAAIKAGNKNKPEELIELAAELERNPDVRYCPHGRPIYFFITKSELEKNFKRT